MDLLRWPALATFTKRKWSRTSLQLVLLVAAAAVVLHGLLGPQIAPRNLATVTTWVHYRGLLVVALLAAGNLFCTACPMIAARDAGRRFVHRNWRWPRALRSKWPALLLFVAVLYCYELFDLWSLPRATAALILGYFAAALAVDLLFSGASFCKYVCPVGQFNFLSSTLSPTELRVRDRETCRACSTVDCIRGRHEPPHAAATIISPAALRASSVSQKRVSDGGRLLQRGCELNIFLPLKVGNMECTLCFDCVRACPHDNIGLMTRVPGEELRDLRRRSGLGRLDRRRDLAALALVFTFGALINAFAMTGPALQLTRWTASLLSIGSETIPLLMLFGMALLLAPALLFGAATVLSTIAAPRADRASIESSLISWAYSLVPLGVGVWSAHYAFHLLTGALTIVPVTQSAVIDLTGRALAGEPAWMLTGVPPGLVYPLQLGCVVLGAIGSAAVAHRLAAHLCPSRPTAASLPWTAIIIVLATASAWILSQPMDMRAVGLQG